jgi:hypothetical protein
MLEVTQNESNEYESRSRRGVLDTTLSNKVCLTCDRWAFSPVSSINKTYRHDINEILLKVALNTITITPVPPNYGHFKIGWSHLE